MQHSLRSHLTFLQHTMLQLMDSLTGPLNQTERVEAESRIDLVNEAINHYRRAFELEIAIRESINAEALAPDWDLAETGPPRQ